LHKREVALMWTNESSELKSFLSGNDAIKLLELIHKSLSSDSEEDLVSLFPKIGELFPFEYVNAALGRHVSSDEIELVQGFNVSFPEEWMREYLSRNYFRVDAVIRENFSTFEAQCWPISRKELYRQKEITSLGMDFGIQECWTHGSRPVSSEKYGSMFCFAGISMKYERRTGAILEFIIPHLHLALCNIIGNRQSIADKPVLSAREREVLDWLKQGKSSWDISMILSISERTVNFHVHNIMRKLGAMNRPQAVAVAARLGLIEIC
jgi:DNA-binding CsgD family transcriptional regulator